MSNPWKESFEDLRESVLSGDALANYASKEMVYDPKTQKFVPKSKTQIPADKAPPAPKLPAPNRDEPLWDSAPSKPNTTTTPSKPTTTPATTTSRPTSSATASTAEKIKGGLDVYKSQVASGDVKGAEETGKSTWALANPELAKREAERQRTRGTSATTNPLMQDMKSRMSAPTPAATTPKPTNATGEPTLMSKLSTPTKTPAKPQLGSARSRTFGENSSNAIKGFLVREGYVREETAKRWWDDDGDGVGYESGEVKGKFKKKKKK